MNDHYKTLQAIFDIVKDDPSPETYKCRPREIILRRFLSWSAIEKQLRLLEEEGMINIKHEDTVVISITKAGIENIKAQSKYQFRD